MLKFGCHVNCQQQRYKKSLYSTPCCSCLGSGQALGVDWDWVQEDHVYR
jgi:hypothetical protein